MILANILARIRGLLLKSKLKVDGKIRSFGKTIVENDNGTIFIGDLSCIWPSVKLSIVSNKANPSPIIKIGKCTSIGDRSEIHAGNSITIGDYVLISWDVNIIEYDYHAAGGGDPESLPIIIEDEVWIGPRAIILKGVTIGKGSIIGAGSVVVKDVPPFSLAAGNPAKVIKQVSSWRGTAPE